MIRALILAMILVPGAGFAAGAAESDKESDPDAEPGADGLPFVITRAGSIVAYSPEIMKKMRYKILEQRGELPEPEAEETAGGH